MDSLFQLLGGSSPYDPAITADAAGSSLMGTLAQPEPQRPPQLQAMDQVQQGYMEANEPPDVPVGKATVDGRTGRWSFSDVSPRFLSEVMGSMNDLKTMQQAAMARVAQLKQQESSGSPLLDALSQLAGGMAANDPTMPGWVRALGATSLQMGPQGIKRERMAEEARATALSKEIAGTSLEAAQLAEKFNSDEQRRIATAEALDKERRMNFFKLEDDTRAQIDRSTIFDEKAYRAKASAIGISPAEQDAGVASLSGYAQAVKAKKDDDRAREIADQDKRNDEWERRFKLERDAADERARKYNEGITDRREQMLATRYSENVMRGSKPPENARQGLEGAAQYVAFVDKAKEAVGKYGKDIGWKRITSGPGEIFKLFRKSTGEELANLAVMDVMEKVKGSGLAPFSELDKEMLASVSFSPWKGIDANLKSLEMGRERAIRRMNSLADLNAQWDWEAMAPGLPKELRSRKDELRQRRIDYWSRYAPAEVDPMFPFKELPDRTPATTGHGLDAAKLPTADGEAVRGKDGKLYMKQGGKIVPYSGG